MSLGNASVVRSTYPDDTHVRGLFVGGGAAASCTKDLVVGAKGIISMAYSGATGKYLITFLDVGITIMDITGTISRAANTAPLVMKPVLSTFSASAKTVSVEIWDLATPTLTDLLTTDKICLNITFIKNKVS